MIVIKDLFANLLGRTSRPEWREATRMVVDKDCMKTRDGDGGLERERSFEEKEEETVTVPTERVACRDARRRAM